MNRLLFIVALVLLLVPAGLAHTGHYMISDVEAFSEEHREALQAAGIADTEALLAATLSGEDREQLARTTGIPASQLREFARLAEFLQLDGVGVFAARLLVAAGVSGVRELAESDAEELVGRIAAANTGARVAPQNPPVESLTAWIASAATAIHHVRD